MLSCISKTGTKTIKRKNLTLVHTTTVTSEDSWKSQLLFGLHITKMTLWGGVLAVLKMKNGYRQCCFVIYFHVKILKSLISYEKCFNFGSKDQHYKIEGLDLISRELKYLNNGKKQGWFYSRKCNFFCLANISKGMAFLLHGLAYIWEVCIKKWLLMTIWPTVQYLHGIRFFGRLFFDYLIKGIV